MCANSSGVEFECVFIISSVVQIKLSWFVIFVGTISYSMDKAIYHCQSHVSLKAPSPKEILVLTGVQEAGTAEAGTVTVGGLLAYKALTSPGPLTFGCKNPSASTARLTLLGTFSATLSATAPEPPRLLLK